MRSPSAEIFPAIQRREREQILNRFEEACQRGTLPRLEEFCPPLKPPVPAPNDPARQELLRELFKMDLEYRWRQAGAGSQRDCPRVEQYFERYPEISQEE